MTVRINFLPKNYQPPKRLGAKEWAIAAAAAVAVVSTGVYYSSVYAGVNSLEQQTQLAQVKLQGVKAQLVSATEIKSREEQVSKAEVELKSLVGRRWSDVLLTLRELTPQAVTWTNLKVDGDSIVLKATGKRLYDVAQLVGGLVDHPDVAEVTLRWVNEQGIPITKVIKAKDQVGAAETVVTLGTYRQLEFEMTITLVKLEGGVPHGA